MGLSPRYGGVSLVELDRSHLAKPVDCSDVSIKGLPPRYVPLRVCQQRLDGGKQVSAEVSPGRLFPVAAEPFW